MYLAIDTVTSLPRLFH